MQCLTVQLCILFKADLLVLHWIFLSLWQDTSDQYFTITAENVPCGTSGVTCTKSVYVVANPNIKLRLVRGAYVNINNETFDMTERQKVDMKDRGLIVEKEGMFIKAYIVNLKIDIFWDGGNYCITALLVLHWSRVRIVS